MTRRFALRGKTFWPWMLLGCSSLMFIESQVELRFFPNGHGHSQLGSTLLWAYFVASGLGNFVESHKCTRALVATQIFFAALSLWFQLR